MVLIFYFSVDQNVSLSVTEVSLFDISSHPNVCSFGTSKAASDGGGYQKSVGFYIYIIKLIFFIRKSLGQMQCIMVPPLLPYFFNMQGGKNVYKANMI